MTGSLVWLTESSRGNGIASKHHGRKILVNPERVSLIVPREGYTSIKVGDSWLIVDLDWQDIVDVLPGFAAPVGEGPDATGG